MEDGAVEIATLTPDGGGALFEEPPQAVRDEIDTTTAKGIRKRKMRKRHLP